jgi:hypothetical protein
VAHLAHRTKSPSPYNVCFTALQMFAGERGRVHQTLQQSRMGTGVSFQLTILKILAGHPEGHASVADLKRYAVVLTSSGPEWAQRMRRLAARAPDLDIFTGGYVVRHDSGWQITETGREFLRVLEAPAADFMVEPAAPRVALVSPDRPANVIQLLDHKINRRRRAAA